MKQLQPEVAEAQSHAEVASTKCKTPMTQVHVEESVSHSDDGEQHEAISVPAASATIVEQLQVDVAKAHSRAEHAERRVSEMSVNFSFRAKKKLELFFIVFWGWSHKSSHHDLCTGPHHKSSTADSIHAPPDVMAARLQSGQEDDRASQLWMQPV